MIVLAVDYGGLTNFKCEKEGGTFVFLRHKVNEAIELLDYHLAND